MPDPQTTLGANHCMQRCATRGLLQTPAIIAILLVGSMLAACDHPTSPPPTPPANERGDFGADDVDRLVIDIKKQLARQQPNAARTLLRQLQQQEQHISAQQRAEIARLEALFAGGQL